MYDSMAAVTTDLSSETSNDAVVLSVDRQPDAVLIRLHVPADSHWFTGHFPEQPLLPGVVQTNWAIEFGRRYLSLPPRFRYLSNMKFMRFILPDTQLELRLQWHSAKSEMSFEYRDDGVAVSSGRIGFTDEAAAEETHS